jgi:hypothetical protein
MHPPLLLPCSQQQLSRPLRAPGCAALGCPRAILIHTCMGSQHTALHTPQQRAGPRASALAGLAFQPGTFFCLFWPAKGSLLVFFCFFFVFRWCHLSPATQHTAQATQNHGCPGSMAQDAHGTCQCRCQGKGHATMLRQRSSHAPAHQLCSGSGWGEEESVGHVGAPSTSQHHHYQQKLVRSLSRAQGWQHLPPCAILQPQVHLAWQWGLVLPAKIHPHEQQLLNAYACSNTCPRLCHAACARWVGAAGALLLPAAPLQQLPPPKGKSQPRMQPSRAPRAWYPSRLDFLPSFCF